MLTKVVSRRFEQNLCQSCGKVATKRVFFSLFQCKLYDVTEAPILVRFRWKYIYLVERVSTVIFVPNSCTFIAYLQSTEEKELSPSKIDQNQYFFPVFASPQHKNVDSYKKYFYAKMTAIQFPLVSRKHEKQKCCVFENNWKNHEGGGNIPPFDS